MSGLADDAALLASELATNAIAASHQPILLRVLGDDRQLIIEIWDRSAADIRPRKPGADSESGRGFTVIEALAHRWGCHRVNSGWKVVWAELLTGGQELS